MKTAKYFILLLFFLFIGCKDESIPPVELKFEIQPLTTGSTYYYADTTINGENWSYDSTRITIPGKTTVTGEPNSQGVAIWDVYTGGNLVRRNFINLEEDGLYHYAEIHGDDTLHLRKMWAKYPVNVGEQFLESRYEYNPASGTFEPNGTWKWHCVSIDSQIVIKNGKTLFCHVFRAAPDNNTQVYLFYALNIGYTGWEVISNQKRIYKQILTDYQIK